MTLNFCSQIDYASFKDGKSKEQDDGKQKILKKKQKNKHNKGTKGSKKGKKQRDAQEDLNRMESLMKVLEMLVRRGIRSDAQLSSDFKSALRVVKMVPNT